MTDQVKRALELVDFWRNLYLNNDGIYGLKASNGYSKIEYLPKVLDFFVSVIGETQLQLADANVIKSLMGDDMNSILRLANSDPNNQEAFVEIKNFLR